MTRVAVLIPVLDRPHRVEPLCESLLCSLTGEHEVRPVFLCSPGDAREIASVKANGQEAVITGWPGGTRGDYARKMNLGFVETDEEWKLLAADDLVFREGWLEACLRAHEASLACVIGTNDLANPRVIAGQHSTHTLVHRDYLECGTIDEAGIILHPGYSHNFVDDEFVATARARGTFAVAGDAFIEHQHPDWGTAEWDETYRIGKARFMEDAAYFQSRAHLWERRL